MRNNIPRSPPGRRLVIRRPRLYQPRKRTISKRARPDYLLTSLFAGRGADFVFCLSLLLGPWIQEKIALALENHFGGTPQDIEWAITGDTIWLLQSRSYSLVRQ
ncbi:MAG TPA: hypothetical protein DCS63_07555 [Elusimicrobia bacterium]|nr:hypothetical protein [Elusimicrobiota bacterium]